MRNPYRVALAVIAIGVSATSIVVLVGVRAVIGVDWHPLALGMLGLGAAAGLAWLVVGAVHWAPGRSRYRRQR